MTLLSQAEIERRLAESAKRAVQVREAAEASRIALSLQETTLSPPAVNLTTPPPSPLTERKR
jgi:hypothetical protein